MNRYDRQIRLKGFGEDGQQRLRKARVLVVGAGGLGVPVCQYLNAMGIGAIGIMDGDFIETSNLHRQPLYTPSDVGKQKVTVLSAFLSKQNPETEIIIYDTFLHSGNATSIFSEYDLVIDATDNLSTRYLIDDACVICNIPWVYGALHAYEGQISVFNYCGGPTYRCLYPEMPAEDEIPDCNTLGTLGILPGIIGNLQVLEAIKVLCDMQEVLSGKLMIYNGLNQNIYQLSFTKNKKLIRPDLKSGNYGRESGCELPGAIEVNSFVAQTRAANHILLIDVREPREYEVGHHPGAINIPLGKLEESLPDLEKTEQVYLICQSGKRSYQAYRELSPLYPKTVFSWITGGMEELKALLR
ncbi:ThiF family adenylyltransferase [Robiginitalea sp. IMCC43444]|uniref:ThiF family adenylyltransferase n=1 Tax=Robiginitalea sp. IMCC43444 TaxID=3459121 RepID=UPI004042AC8C